MGCLREARAVCVWSCTALSALQLLRGASEPQELVTRAVALGYGPGLTDECSLAGVVRATGNCGGAARSRAAGGHLARHPAQLLIGSEFLVRDDAGTPRFARADRAEPQRLRQPLPVHHAVAAGQPGQGREYTLHWRQIAAEQLGNCLACSCCRATRATPTCCPRPLAAAHFHRRAWLAVELLREASDARWLQRLQALSEATALPWWRRATCTSTSAPAKRCRT